VYPAFAHHGTGVSLVHNVKYRRSLPAARLLADEMARRVPVEAQVLVPIPRVLARRVAYGIDQTAVLASLIAEIIGVRVVECLSVPMWQRRLAGSSRIRRKSPSFHVKRATNGVVLVDDVITTGTTLIAAASVLGRANVIAAVTATSAGRQQRSGVGSPKSEAEA